MSISKLSRFADGVMEAAWLAAVMLTPVFFNVYSSRIFEPDKIAWLRSLALVAIIAWLVKTIDQGRTNGDQVGNQVSFVKRMWQVPLMPAVFLMMFAYIVASIFSVSPQTSFWGSYQRLQGTYTFFSYLVIFFTLIGNLRRRSQVERLVTTIIVASLPVAFYGILQRFKLDPVPWGGNTSIRVASSLGNSIFVAAYLIMTVPLTLMRVVQAYLDILNKPEIVARAILRGAFYIFIFILQLLTIYFSGSRGPLLGLLAGLYLFILLLSLIFGKRWVTYVTVLVALVGAAFLLTLNLPNGPLTALSESPAVGRFGTLLDTQSNTAKVRLYIWEGVVRMLSPHDPLEYPDGSIDIWNFIRPVVGYGPESMYVAYNPFYSSELGHVERRNASPDRSHNETWDSLVTTGLFGFVAYMLLFLGIFYYAFTWLKLVNSVSQRRLYWGLAGLGGLIGSIFVVAWGGLAYLGVGLPFGVAIGLLVYLAIISVSGKYEKPSTNRELLKAILLSALASAIMAHWLEINFGIAIAATRTYFWVYTGLLLVLGYILPHQGIDITGEAATPAARADRPAKTPDRGERSRRAMRGSTQKRNGIKVPGWLLSSLPAALLLSILMIILGYDFITNSSRAIDTGEILWNSFARLSAENNTPSYGILVLFVVTWLVGGMLHIAEGEPNLSPAVLVQRFGVVAAISLGLFLAFAFWHAGGLSSIAGSPITTVDELLGQVSSLGNLLTRMYWFVFLLMAAFGVVLGASSPAPTREPSIIAPLVGLVGMFFVVFMIQSTNLQIIQADVAFKMAEPFNTPTQWPVATRLYQYSIDLASSEDHYYLFLGRSYLEQAKEQTDVQQQVLLMNQAENDLKRAQRINPLNTDHTANLARLNTWRASSSSESQERLKRAEEASDYYRIATTLSPNNATLWGEWATLLMEISGNYEQAKSILDRAAVVDPEYNYILGLLGDYELRMSRQVTALEERRLRISAAVGYYERAIAVSLGRDAGTKVNYMISLGNAHIELAVVDSTSIDSVQLLQAIQVFNDVLNLNSPSIREWQLNEQIARLYLQLDDRVSAQPFLQSALAEAPEDQKARIEELYTQIYGQP